MQRHAFHRCIAYFTHCMIFVASTHPTKSSYVTVLLYPRLQGCASPTLSSNTHLISPACNEEFKNLRHTDFEFTQGNPLAQAQAQLKRKVTLIRRPACALSPLLVSSSSPSSPELRPPQLISRPGELEQCVCPYLA